MALARRNGALCNITQFPLVDYSPVTGELKVMELVPTCIRKPATYFFGLIRVKSRKVDEDPRIVDSQFIFRRSEAQKKPLLFFFSQVKK